MFKIKITDLKLLALIIMLAPLSVSFLGAKGSVAESEVTTYTPEIASKLVTRCDIIKDYLSSTVRIDELATRQNKVRGWEYVLRRLVNLEESYSRFNVDYKPLSSDIASLRRQLEQFKVDFEAYDSEFQRLLSVSCKSNPQEFWRELETLRAFRAGIALSVENYKASLESAITKEDAKW